MRGTEKENKKKGMGSLKLRFMEEYSSFPICNHTRCVYNNNIGFVQGFLDDGTPFEAEIWRNEIGLNISIVMPDVFLCQRRNNGLVEGNSLGFHNQEQRIHQGILAIGMIDDGVCEDLNIIINYVDFLEEKGEISFVGEMRNGVVFFVPDVEGKELVYNTVTLEEDEVFATTPLHFIKFLDQSILKPWAALRGGFLYST